MTSSPPAPATPLPSAPAARWLGRVLFYFVALVVLGVPAYLLLQPVYRHARMLAWQRRIMEYARPPSTVVYEEDPDRAAELLRGAEYAPLLPAQSFDGTPPGWRPAAHVPAVWREWGGAGTHESSAVVFLHGRRSPAGRERIVDVRVAVLSADRDSRSLVLYGRTSVPATWKPGSGPTPVNRPAALPASTRPASLHLSDRYDEAFRFFAGQPDPSDPSRFTLGYELNGRPGTIEGQLGDEDVVRFQVRDGPAAPREGL